MPDNSKDLEIQNETSENETLEDKTPESKTTYAFMWDYYEDRVRKRESEKKRHRREALLYTLTVCGAFAVLLLLLAFTLLK